MTKVKAISYPKEMIRMKTNTLQVAFGMSKRIWLGNSADSIIIKVQNSCLKMKSVLWSAHCLPNVTRP